LQLAIHVVDGNGLVQANVTFVLPGGRANAASERLRLMLHLVGLIQQTVAGSSV